MSADGSRVFVFGRGNDNRIWWARSYDGALTWNVAWGVIGGRLFQSDPAAAVSADGQTVLVVGRGTDDLAYLALSYDAGNTWIDSPIGSRFVERMLSVHATLKQQMRNVLDYLTDACRCWLAGRAPPSLLPTTS